MKSAYICAKYINDSLKLGNNEKLNDYVVYGFVSRYCWCNFPEFKELMNLFQYYRKAVISFDIFVTMHEGDFCLFNYPFWVISVVLQENHMYRRTNNFIAHKVGFTTFYTAISRNMDKLRNNLKPHLCSHMYLSNAEILQLYLPAPIPEYSNEKKGWMYGANYERISTTFIANEIKGSVRACFKFKIPQEILHKIIEYILYYEYPIKKCRRVLS